jgi:hypothetical protein
VITLRYRQAAAAAAISVAALLAVSSLAALGHSPDPVLSGGLFAQNQALSYRWGSGGTPPTAMRNAINAAAGDSNASRRSKAPTFAYDAAGGNTIYYGTDVPCGVNGLACFRRTAPTSFGIWLRENGHRYDWGSLRWCEMTGDPDGCYDAENITLDELGHVHGLDHHVNYADDSDYADSVVQTYSHAKPKVGWSAHSFGRCDVATLQQQYDVLSTTTPYSTCLDVPSSITLTASRISVLVGTSVTFTATLKSAGSGRLSDNAVAGRVVVLQQRTAGGWTDALTMSAGSTAGSYAGSLVVRTTTELRALFRKPSGEGLRSSSSSSVVVTATPPCLMDVCPAMPIGVSP